MEGWWGSHRHGRNTDDATMMISDYRRLPVMTPSYLFPDIDLYPDFVITVLDKQHSFGQLARITINTIAFAWISQYIDAGNKQGDNLHVPFAMRKVTYANEWRNRPVEIDELFVAEGS
jgi:hypothetical protein